VGDDWKERYIADEVTAHGAVRPPWVYADAHPYDICWRMGGGESHLMAFWAWWPTVERTVDERLAFIQRWNPPPFWFPWSAGLIWPELDPEGEPEDGDYEARERRLVEAFEGAGLGTVAAWDEANRDADSDAT
jgi:hypothetical protein